MQFESQNTITFLQKAKLIMNWMFMWYLDFLRLLYHATVDKKGASTDAILSAGHSDNLLWMECGKLTKLSHYAYSILLA